MWTHRLLDELRQIGDPMLDLPDEHGRATWRSVHKAGLDSERGFRGSDDAQLLQTWRGRTNGALPDPDDVDPNDWFWTQDPLSADDSRLELAQDLFVLNGGEIAAALLMSALPATYAAATGAEVLGRTGELESNARRRIAETAQLTVDVMFPEEKEVYAVATNPPESRSRSLQPGGHGYTRVLSTRLTHAVIRDLIGSASEKWDPQSPAPVPRCDHEVLRGVPINQEDLLGVLGTFTISVIDAVAKLGVRWTPEAQQAYLDLWDRVGALLGIGGEHVTAHLLERRIPVPDHYVGRLRPRTVAEFRTLADLIIERSWPIPKPRFQMPPFEAAQGKVLVRALLDELQAAMPRGGERLPLLVMRYLVHPDAQELLGLGGGGMVDALVQVPEFLRRRRAGSNSVSERTVGLGMRMIANEVSRRAFVRFINETDFRFPPASREDLQPTSPRRGDP